MSYDTHLIYFKYECAEIDIFFFFYIHFISSINKLYMSFIINTLPRLMASFFHVHFISLTHMSSIINMLPRSIYLSVTEEFRNTRRYEVAGVRWKIQPIESLSFHWATSTMPSGVKTVRLLGDINVFY